jgi:hypothetical protein
VRISQFITTYGPSSILEGPFGPRIVLRPDIGLFYGERNPEEFEISHGRMEKLLKMMRGDRTESVKIFRIPSNQELGYDERVPVYRTREFLEWALCPKHGVLYRIKKGCPECREKGRRQETIRFVLACARGHLDDVDWDLVVHGEGSQCRPGWYWWVRRGSSLRDVEILCPRCKKRANLGLAYTKQDGWKCSGRYPETEPEPDSPQRGECDERAQIIMRQASNLYIPEVLALFTIPPAVTPLHRILRIGPILHVLLADRDEIRDKEQLLKKLENLKGKISPESVRAIQAHSWEDIRKAIDDVLQEEDRTVASIEDLLEDEFKTLVEASEHGYPPYRAKGRGDVLFQAERGRRIRCGEGGVEFLVTPVTRLHVVLALRGYRRLRPEARPKDIGFRRGDSIWYPGCELLGEGIFITLADREPREIGGDEAERWMEAHENPGIEKYPAHVFRSGEKRELHPVFVWWHTLSHILIRTISADCGYPAASIRERVYITGISGRRARGGIILYTVQPGGGTLGGLLSQARRFDEILELAEELAENCSNDPVCRENAFRNGGIHGAACYACTMISETSCEHRNMWLDRRILLEASPWASDWP